MQANQEDGCLGVQSLESLPTCSVWVDATRLQLRSNTSSLLPYPPLFEERLGDNQPIMFRAVLAAESFWGTPRALRACKTLSRSKGLRTLPR
jgi:hypothetical protein